MKRRLKATICLILIWILTIGSSIVSSAYVTHERELADFKKTLLIQDKNPWDSQANFTVLKEIKASYDIISTADFKADLLADYGLVILANDQTTATYNAYVSFTEELEAFTRNGGTVLYGACDEGWGKGTLSDSLLGGVQKESRYDNNNYIAEAAHPIVTGALSGGNALADEDLYSNYCSHTYFIEDTLPEGTTVILRSKTDDSPTLIEYPLGKGYVIANGLTWEHNYVKHTGNDSYGTFARKALDDLFLYAMSYYDSVFDQDTPYETYSDFKLGRDNNSFCHTNSSFDNAGFRNVKSYYLNEETWDVLKDYTVSKSELNDLKRSADRNWEGSCYGIAATMGLVYQKNLSAENIADVDKNTSFYDLPMPYLDDTLLSTINFYQLSQSLALGGKKYAATSMTYNPDYYKFPMKDYSYDSVSTFLKKLVQTTSKGNAVLLGYSYRYEEKVIFWITRTKTSGHAILATGCAFDGTDYKIRLYDENCIFAKGSTGNFITMTVDKDFSQFSFTDSNGDYITNTNFDIMYILNWNKLPVLYSAYPDSYDYVDTGDTIILCSNAYPFKLTDESGKILAYNGITFSGDLDVNSIEQIEYANSFYTKFVVKSGTHFDLSDMVFGSDLTIYNRDDYVALQTKHADAVQIELGKAVWITGNDEYTFDVALSTGNEIAAGEAGLGAVAASANGKVTVTAENGEIAVDAERDMENITEKIYIGTNLFTARNKKAKTLSFITDIPFARITIRNQKKYDRTTQAYKTSMVFRAETDSLPEAEISWNVEGADFKINPDGSCTVIKAKTPFRISCSTTDEYGNILTSEEENIYIKDGYLDKLVGFVKDLLEILPTVEQ